MIVGVDFGTVNTFTLEMQFQKYIFQLAAQNYSFLLEAVHERRLLFSAILNPLLSLLTVFLYKRMELYLNLLSPRQSRRTSTYKILSQTIKPLERSDQSLVLFGKRVEIFIYSKRSQTHVGKGTPII